MLNSIPIDIVEIIIIKSFNYKTFQELQNFLIKLKEPSRTARINDKLTVVTFVRTEIYYSVNNHYHREYDKPDYIDITRCTWSLYNSETRIDKPSCCWTDGCRRWCVDYKEYRNNNNPCFIDKDGEQKWSDKNRNPYWVRCDGRRNNYFFIFRYL